MADTDSGDQKKRKRVPVPRAKKLKEQAAKEGAPKPKRKAPRRAPKSGATSAAAPSELDAPIEEVELSAPEASAPAPAEPVQAVEAAEEVVAEDNSAAEEAAAQAAAEQAAAAKAAAAQAAAKKAAEAKAAQAAAAKAAEAEAAQKQLQQQKLQQQKLQQQKLAQQKLQQQKLQQQKLAQAKAAAGGGTAAPAGPAKKRAAKKVSARRPGAAAAKAPARPSPQAQPKKPVNANVDDSFDDDFVDEEFHVATKSKAPLFIIIGLVVVVAGAFLVYSSMQSSNNAKQKEQADQQAKEDKAAAEQAEKDAKKLALDSRVKNALSASNNSEVEPTERMQALASLINSLGEAEGEVEASKQLTDRFNELEAECRKLSQDKWLELKTQVQAHHKANEFAEAYALVQEMPFEIYQFQEGVVSSSEWSDFQLAARMEKEAYEIYTDRYAKAMSYLTSSTPSDEVATMIMEIEWSDKYEAEAPRVWQLRTEAIQKIKTEGVKALLENEKEIEKIAAAERERKRLARLEKRRLHWQKRINKVPWQRQLGSHTYNWVASSDNNRMVDSGQERPSWKHKESGGTYVMSGRASESALFNGVFTNHWEDYVLEFEVKVKSGTFALSPRSKFNTNAGAITEQSEKIEFKKEDGFGSDFVKIRVEVNGNRVTVKNLDKGTEKVYDGDGDYSLTNTGGFIFFIEASSAAEFRNVKTKLVSSTRTGIF